MPEIGFGHEIPKPNDVLNLKISPENLRKKNPVIKEYRTRQTVFQNCKFEQN